MSELQKNLKHYRISSEEYLRILKELGRDLRPIEWPLFSALWSEHCSYKSSRVHLKKLYTEAPWVLQGPGENAGVIDLGEGERIAFKMESHNHPSFIEPTQGAATGVGGILRDIFTMGARPLASMNYLCFGDEKDVNTPRLLHGVVRGIGGYGNCVGVATVNGQTTFHKSYNQNNLVNAFSAGLFRPGEEIFYGKAEGVGNLIVYAGAATGRDGVHGAAMASESFDSDMEKKKPNVQIGDPFYEKLLIEACLEVMKQNLVVGIQDMGAAGLTSSTFEMASRAQTGLEIDLMKIPLREPGISAEEILLSESQERMVLIVEPKNLDKVVSIFKKWDLECAEIGKITSGNLVKLSWGDEVLTEISHVPLVDQAPKYDRPFVLPEPAISQKPVLTISKKEIKTKALEFLASTPMTSRDWITHQYDQRVGAKTVFSCEDSVATLRLPDSGRMFSMATGCRPLIMDWDVEVGAMDAVALPVLQMAVRGAKALATTDCLNFGNPEKPKVMGQFVKSLESLNTACKIFQTPIVSGNVSLYNETLGENIIPTPAIGIVGLGPKINGDFTGPRGGFSFENLELGHFDIYLVSVKNQKLGLFEASKINKVKDETEKSVESERFEDWSALAQLQKCFLELATEVKPEVSRVIGRGGFFRTMAQIISASVPANYKITTEISDEGFTPETSYFAERFYSSVWFVSDKKKNAFETVCGKYSDKVEYREIGNIRCDTSSTLFSGAVSGSLDCKNLCEFSLADLLIAQRKGLKHLVESLI